MTSEIKLSSLPESVSEATLVSWFKKEGEQVKQNEKLAEIETDKVVLEIDSPVSGRLSKIIVAEGETIIADTLLGYIEEMPLDSDTVVEHHNSDKVLSPSVRAIVSDNELDANLIPATGKHNRLLKADVLAFLEKNKETQTALSASEKPLSKEPPSKEFFSKKLSSENSAHEPRRVPMSRIRVAIAIRLVEAQKNAAILSTFNEVDLTQVIALRSKFGESFKKKYGVKLGFMSFFVKVVTDSLKHFPIINASIEDSDILYHDYFDIGIAVGSERGLVVPILRDCDQMSFVQIESTISEYSVQAREGKISIEDITGGTFTISNGGVYGSLLSTPILNPPQSAILGLHKIQKRAVVIEDEIKIRPMMNLALSYDHRLIDGSDAVKFLVMIKERIEQPGGLLLDL